MTILFDEDNSAADLDYDPTARNSEITIAGRAAVLSHVPGNVPLCSVIIDLSDSSNVSTNVGPREAGRGKINECELAKQAAELIAPRVLVG